MNIKLNFNILCLTAICVFFSSCLNLVDETQNWFDNKNINDLPGKYHFLEDNGTKVFLPNDFERVSLSEYQHLLDSLVTKKAYRFETKRLNSLSEMDGSLYLFFDKNSQSTYTINTVPYMKFSKNDAGQLLGLINLNNEKASKNTGAIFKKITAKFGGNKSQQLFKTIYRISDKNIENDMFNSTYIISAKDKTVYVQLTTGFEADFDPFIEKMML